MNERVLLERERRARDIVGRPRRRVEQHVAHVHDARRRIRPEHEDAHVTRLRGDGVDVADGRVLRDGRESGIRPHQIADGERLQVDDAGER